VVVKSVPKTKTKTAKSFNVLIYFVSFNDIWPRSDENEKCNYSLLKTNLFKYARYPEASIPQSQ